MYIEVLKWLPLFFISQYERCNMAFYWLCTKDFLLQQATLTVLCVLMYVCEGDEIPVPPEWVVKM